MRLVKSRMHNTTIHSQAGEGGEAKLFPQEVLFVLSNEEANLVHFRSVIEEDKARVEKDFKNLEEEVSHIL